MSLMTIGIRCSFMKKISSSDVSQVVRKNVWSSGVTYDMWRNDISRDNPSLPSGSFDIYEGKIIM